MSLMSIIQNLLSDFKDCTCALRSGELCPDIDLQFGRESDDTLLQHDDILLPRWRELANALQLYHNPNPLNIFSVYNVQLTSSVIDMLSPALNGNKIEKLILNNNDFVHISEGIEFAVEVIKSNPNMKNFSWDYNQLESIENAHLVLDAVINHPSIHRIRLESCLGGTGYEALRTSIIMILKLGGELTYQTTLLAIHRSRCCTYHTINSMMMMLY